MRVRQLFMFFLLLCGGGPVLIRAEIPVYTAAEGRNLKVRFLFYESGTRKFFCKNVCNKTEDILVETTSFRHQNGRYSIRYEKHSSYPDVMHVSITDVRSSDSGPYSCGLETGSGPIKFMEFMVKGPNSAPVEESTAAPASTTAHIYYQQNFSISVQRDPVSSGPSPLLWLLLILIPIVMVMISCTKNGSQNDQNTTVNTRVSETEIGIYENCETIKAHKEVGVQF